MIIKDYLNSKRLDGWNSDEEVIGDFDEDGFLGFSKKLVDLLPINDVSYSVAEQYADFCVRCDREKLPLIKIEDYLKQL